VSCSRAKEVDDGWTAWGRQCTRGGLESVVPLHWSLDYSTVVFFFAFVLACLL
jgi:hypothetical protein